MKRFTAAAVLALSTGSSAAWEAGVDGRFCTLNHTEDDVSVRLTYDPSVPLYTISIRTAEPWDVAPQFAMTFEGPRPNTIRTDRQVLAPDLRMLSVSDRGFGNVLDGLQFNTTARAISGTTTVSLGLDGAAAEVAAFRACGEVPSV